MTKPLAISLLVHGGLVGLLIGAPSTATTPQRKPVSLVTVEVTAAPPPAETVPSRVSAVVRPPKKPVAQKNEQERKGRGEAPRAVDVMPVPAKSAGDGNADGVHGARANGPDGTLLAAVSEGSGSTAPERPASDGAGRGTANPALSRNPGPAQNLSRAYNAIRETIERAARRGYPIQARKLGIEGVVTVRFAVGPDGAARGVVVLAGSGSDLLDEAALSIVSAAGPYPRVPDHVQIPIRFSLGG